MKYVFSWKLLLSSILPYVISPIHLFHILALHPPIGVFLSSLKEDHSSTDLANWNLRIDYGDGRVMRSSCTKTGISQL